MTKILCALAVGTMLLALGGCTDFLSNDLGLNSEAMRNTEAQAFPASHAAGSDVAMPAKTGNWQ